MTKSEGRKAGGNQKSLFFGSLPKEWSVDEFEKIVREVFQDVESVTLPNMPGKRGQNRGFGFASFSSHAAAARAFNLGSKSGFLLGGKCHPNVEWAAEESETDTKEDDELDHQVKIAFLRDLPSDVSEDFVERLFVPYGKLEKVVLSKKTNCQVGFVHFVKRSDLDNAIKHMNGKSVQGMNAGSSFKLQVEVARPYEKNKKRARDESSKPSGSNMSVSKVPKGQPEFSHVPKAVQEPIAIDPYEATVISLPDPIKDRLLRILRLGIATRYDIDLRFLRDLKELPEATSISILDQFMLSAADEINKGAFLAALIAKHVNTLRLNAAKLPEPRYLSRVGPVDDVGSDIPRLYGRSQVALESSTHARTAPAKYGSYTSHSPPLLDYSVSHRPDVRKADPPAVPLHQPVVLVPSYRRTTSEYALGAPSTEPLRQQIRSDSYISRLSSSDYTISPQASIPIVDKPSHPVQLASVPLTSYRRVETNSPTGALSIQPARPQVRFDPFTGQPYKFDPFTGEPILPESTHR